MTLSVAAQAQLASADPASVVEAFGQLRRYLQQDRWLGLRNAYATDTVRRIDTDLGTTPSSINDKHLVEYIAASVPIHAIDGWSYLGRALSAHMAGDVFAARHLAYYAELRAAMCLLATQGIGVFNKRHFVVTSRSGAQVVTGGGGTHVFAWDALKWWAATPQASNVIGDVIEPYQVKLRTWLAGATGYAAWAPVAQDWIQNLGVDLNRAANDQRSRNEASYRPTRIRTPRPVNVRRGAEFTIGLWLSLEPTPSGFERLDRHFLRRSFEEAYKSVAGRRPNPAKAHYTAAVDGLLAGNNVTEPRLSFLRNFLLRGTEPDDLLVLRNASVDSRPTAEDHHLHVLSRATLLLTIASLSARSVIRRATISPEDTRFWWQLVGSDRGVWGSQQPPLNLHDYWEDVQVELDDLQAWLDNGGEEAASLAVDCSRPLARLAQLELAGLWGIAA
ncbi:MAG: hypothetical protein AB7Q27_06760 [Acidimicrobiia bacterium]